MRTVFAVAMVNVATLFLGTAAHAEADLPLTPAFAQAVGDYRDCVIGGLDRSASSRPDRMAAAAMAACAPVHQAVRAQLAADLNAAHPRISLEAAKAKADAGMAKIDPMIAAVAMEQARALTGEASATGRPLARSGTIG